MIAAYQHGLYPRSEALVAATRDLDRGRTTLQAVAEQETRDQLGFVRLQQEAGLDYFSDGQLRWQDLFRPLVETSPGLKVGPLVRWFDNNAFYRAPVVAGPLSLNGSLPAVFKTGRELPPPRLACLPSPFLFARVTLGEANPARLMLELAEHVLRPLAGGLVRQGYNLIQLQEPWLTFHGISAAEWEAFSRSLALITEGLGVTTVLHTYFGDAGPYASRLRELPVDVVGIDFLETDVEALGANWPKGILAGCLNGRNSLVESSEAIVEFVIRLADNLQPPTIYLSSNSGLELLPERVARHKVRRLGEAARQLMEQLR